MVDVSSDIPSAPSEGGPPSASESAAEAVRLVLVADRSAEGERVVEALRAHGYSVVTSDAIALPERVARIDPFAVLVDIEQAHAEVAMHKLRASRDEGDESAAGVILIALGERRRARELGVTEDGRTRIFERPVASEPLLAYLGDLAAGLPPRSVPSKTGEPQSSGSGLEDALSDFPAIAGLPEVEDILPDLDRIPLSAKTTSQLSPEIEALLERAAQRAKAVEPDLGPLVQETNIPVPADMLSLIDDLLAPDESPETRGGAALTDMGYGVAPDLPHPAESSDEGDPLDTGSSHAGFYSSPGQAGYSGPGYSSSGMGSGAGFSQPGTGPGSDFSVPGAAPSAITGMGTSPGHDDDEPPPPPSSRGDSYTGAGTSSGTGIERTHAPGTQVGPHRRDLDSAPPEPGVWPGSLAPSAPASPRALPSMAASTLRQPSQPSAGTGPPRRSDRLLASDNPVPSGGFPSVGPQSGSRRGSQPPERTALGDISTLRGQSDAPPESVVPSDMAPMTHAQRMAFSSRAPQGTPHPAVSFYGVDEPLPDSTQIEQGDPIALLARAVVSRATGALVLSTLDGRRVRRILMRDGDMVNAASEDADDALMNFLIERGDLSPEVAQLRSAKLPTTGRHAAAALIAHGFLGQDDLWPVLRAHAEWIISRALCERPALCRLEREPPERLRSEPNVFGGAAGVEIFIESIRRVMTPDEAIAALGGPGASLHEGPRAALLAESALTGEETELVRNAGGDTVGHVLGPKGADFAPVLFALAALEIISARQKSGIPSPAPPDFDPLDADAVRKRVAARLALVQDGDYFSLLGVTASATGYDIRRAYLDLRRTFEPNRLLTAATADLREDVDLIVDVLDEAYQILRDPQRRSRYRRAIEAARVV